jgi:hypothetical protein
MQSFIINGDFVSVQQSWVLFILCEKGKKKIPKRSISFAEADCWCCKCNKKKTNLEVIIILKAEKLVLNVTYPISFLSL